MIRKLRISLLCILACSSIGCGGVFVYGLFRPGVSSLQAAPGARPPFDFWRKGTTAHLIFASPPTRGQGTALPRFDVLGLSYGRWIDAGVRRTYHAISLPLWIPAILFGAPPFLSLVRGPIRRRHRRRHGLCVQCAYNLNGLPEPRCPECGTRI